MRLPVYVAHQLNAPTAEGRQQNRERASRWVGWLASRYLIAPIADWMSSVWDETPENRAHGLEIARVLVELCGTIVLVGPRVSEGMKFEAEWARTVVDLTGIGQPPALLDLFEQLDECDRRMAVAGIGRSDV